MLCSKKAVKKIAERRNRRRSNRINLFAIQNYWSTSTRKHGIIRRKLVHLKSAVVCQTRGAAREKFFPVFCMDGSLPFREVV